MSDKGKLAPGPRGGVPPSKKDEEIDLRIVHWCNWGPGQSGLYETTRELIAAEMKIEGVLPGMCVLPPPDASPGVKNRYIMGDNLVDHRHPEMRAQDWGWGQKFGNIHLIHFSFDKRLSSLKPKAFFVHGCFHNEQLIRMIDGSMKPIPKVQVGDLVPSRNRVTGKIEPKRVTWIGKNGISRNWKRIRFEHGPDSFVTGNHPYYMSDGHKVRAENLQPGDALMATKFILTSIQEEIILGSLLGDGYMQSSSWEFTHKKENSDYNDILLGFFNGFGIRRKSQISGFGTEMDRVLVSLSRKQTGRESGTLRLEHDQNPFRSIRDICYSNGKKKVTDEWINRLSWLSLAVLYLDDGSLGRMKYERQDGISEYITSIDLALCSFSAEEIDLLSRCLMERFGLLNKHTSYNGDHRLHIYGKENIAKFFDGISNQLPIPPSMTYKFPSSLPEPLRKSDELTFGEYENHVKSIADAPFYPSRKGQASRGLTRWAITVEDNHNYFAGFNLVANTVEACIDSSLREKDDANAFLSAAEWIDRFEATFVTSHQALQYWSVFDNTGGKKMHLLNKGIDLDWWQRGNVKRDLEGKPSVLYGELWRSIKHPGHLFYAMNEIFNRNPEARLNVWACDAKREFWEHFIRQGNFGKYMGQNTLPGIIDYPEHMYNRGDVLVSPVKEGDLSRTAQEAMAHGCPVVSWDTDPWQDNHAWKLAKPFDIHDLAAKIEETYQEVLDDREGVAKKCRTIAEKYFNIDQEAKDVVAVLRQVIAESS